MLKKPALPQALNQKVASIIGLSIFALTFAQILLLWWNVFPNFVELDKVNATRNADRIISVLEQRASSLEAINIEYSRWDDTYYFMQGQIPTYLEDNFFDSAMEHSNVTLGQIYDLEGKMVFNKVVRPAHYSEQVKSSVVQANIPDYYKKPDPNGVLRTGIAPTSAGLMLLASAPIVKNDSSGAAAGAFVFGVLMDERFIREVENEIQVEFDIWDLDNSVIPQAVLGSWQSLSDSNTIETRDYISSYRLLEYPSVGSRFLLRTKTPTEISAIGRQAMIVAEYGAIALGIIIVIILAVALRKLFTNPLIRLKNSVLEIGRSGRYNGELATSNDDEIGVLSREIHKTLRKLEEAQIAAESANRAKSRFLANMSHEIRTPMNGVIGMADLIARSELTFHQRRQVSAIRESGEALIKVIDDILDYSKIESGKFELEIEQFDLHALLADMVDLFSGIVFDKNICLNLSVGVDVPQLVSGDGLRLRQVISNIVGNAVKFTEEGSVNLNVELLDREGNNCIVEFAISDTGIGVSSEKLERLFKPFEQEESSTSRRFGGTGLGLAISKDLVELMGGSISASSVPGEGTSFRFTVNLQEEVSDCIDRSTKTADIAGRRALIVDDNKNNLEILHHYLSEWGIDVTSAPDGETALGLVQDGQGFDFAILDMKMPGISGLELAKEISKSQFHPKFPVILLTSLSTPVSKFELEDADIMASLSKPIRASELYGCLARILKSQHCEKQSAPNAATGVRHTFPKTIRVLLSEDNPVNQAVAQEQLEQMNCDVDLAENGQQAVELYRSRTYDVVLMDCQMPVMDGLEATQVIRSIEKTSQSDTTPIIALSANALPEDRDECIKSGMDAFLSKPFKSDQLFNLLRNHLSAEPKPQSPALPNADPSHKSCLGKGPGHLIESIENIKSPTIDQKTLLELCKIQRPGKPLVLEKILSVYLTTTPGLISEMHERALERDYETIGKCAHTVKSSSQNVGAINLARACLTLETNMRSGRHEMAAANIESINVEFQEVKTILERLLRQSEAYVTEENHTAKAI